MPTVRRSTFDLSHERKLSCDMGKLIPIMCEEIMPGDFFKVKTNLVTRISPLLAPMMHRVDIFTHFYFVPNRLVWTDWEKFITGGEDGLDATAWPYMSLAGPLTEGGLEDYFGLPVRYDTATPPVSIAYDAPIQVSALPFRGYQAIWNDWYRDTEIQAALAFSKANGLDSTTTRALLSRNWEKDYYTSARLKAQLGNPVTVPLGTEAPVLGIGKVDGSWTGSSGGSRRQSDGSSVTYASFRNIGVEADGMAGLFSVEEDPDRAGYPNIRADLQNATAATINQLRQAFQIQKWMERNSRASGRYISAILSHFGVKSSDSRLQRCEYLGGGRSPVVVSEVVQTSETSANSPQGNLAGHGFSIQNDHAFEKSFEEHGYVIGVMSVMPRTAYQQGLPRSWTRSSRYDYPWPEFAGLGAQAVYNKELFCTGAADDANVFGYQGRYDEFRRRESTVHGAFRNSLDYWHMGRKFTSLPTLSSNFLTADPTKRIAAVPAEPNCLVQVYHDVKAVRPLPIEAVPGIDEL